MKPLAKIFALMFIIASFISAQAQNEAIRLQSGDAYLEAIESSTTIAEVIKETNNPYQIIQFNNIPTDNQKRILKENGITLLGYIPNKAFTSKIEGVSKAKLSELDITGITAFDSKFKTSIEFDPFNAPEYAKEGSNLIKVTVNVHEAGKMNTLIEFLQNNSIRIDNMTEDQEFINISLSPNMVSALSNENYVSNIEYVSPPSELEDTRGRSIHRNNVIDSDHPLGRKYDGTGVSLAIMDDGQIGPHIDLQGRFVYRNTPNNNGTHGDMTTGIAMGGGNLDPRYRGMATGAFLHYYDFGGTYPHISGAVANYTNDTVVITSTSYSQGCNGGVDATTIAIDRQVNQTPQLLHVFSAGNSAGSSCGNPAGRPWGTVTGGRKQGKNVIAVANLFYNGTLVNSSSRGPARDGRIKPDISAHGQGQMSLDDNNAYAVGGGTSAAAPGIAGVSAQLYQAYRALNGGTDPESGLIKAALLNTARDLGNRGPDFSFGWGRVNTYKALKLLETNRYTDSTISQNNTNSHSISVPSNLEQLRVMIYWTDKETNANTSVNAPALVNNLDLRLVTSLGDTIRPWVLNSTPTSAALNSPATRGIDNLNNVEQVTIDTVPSGNYTVLVNGTSIPFGPQKYQLVWEFVSDSIEVTYPYGGESFVPNETETIRWDAHGNSGTFLIEYSSNNGSTWNTIGSVSGTLRHFDWRVPNITSGNVLVRVSRSGISDNSDYTFSIMGLPTNVGVQYICPDSVRLRWNSVSGATSYEIYKMGSRYMDSIGTSSTTNFDIYNLNLSNDHWFAVKAIGNGIQSRRTNAFLLPKVPQNCPLDYDFAITQINSPAGSFATNCSYPKLPVTITVTNQGDSLAINVPLRLRVGNQIFNDTFPGPLARNGFQTFTFSDSINVNVPGRVNISVISDQPNDANEINDSLGKPVDILPSTVFTPPYTNDFENFPFCSTANNCGSTNCSLNSGWLNLPNGVDDVHDMRVNAGGTPSTGTGPTADHNPGTTTGKYIYSEASGTCSSSESIVVTPCFDLTNAITPEFSFWYHSFGTSTGFIRLDIFANGRWNNNIMTPTFGSLNAWQQRIVNLSAYTGQRVNLRFRITTGSSWSSDMAIDDVSLIDRAVSIDEITTNSKLSIFPNPSTGMFTIEFTEDVNKNLRIYDIHGRVVYEDVLLSNSNQVDLSFLPKGIYVVDLDEGEVKQKIIIQ